MRRTLPVSLPMVDLTNALTRFVTSLLDLGLKKSIEYLPALALPLSEPLRSEGERTGTITSGHQAPSGGYGGWL